ncbi:MAG: hypothetical protein ABSB25_04360 [Sedimentisphaerales bacterium]|jgi:hypothetical protein
MKTIIKKVIGVILIIVGVFALLTPLTPGSWLALIGLELLGVRMLFFRKFLSDKQMAALDRFMKKLGVGPDKQVDDKPDKKEK